MAIVKTTVYLDAEEYRRLKALAGVEGRPAAELIRAAVAEYVTRRRRRPVPGSVGAGSSRDGTLSERAEDLLTRLGTPG